jgi:hypothetical protein
MKTIHLSVSEIVQLPAPKGPTDELPYRMDWGPFLNPLGDAVLTSAWDAGGLDAAGEAIEPGGQGTTLRLSGGTAGVTYTVSNTVTTTGGRTVKRSFKVRVEDR